MTPKIRYFLFLSKMACFLQAVISNFSVPMVPKIVLVLVMTLPKRKSPFIKLPVGDIRIAFISDNILSKKEIFL